VAFAAFTAAQPPGISILGSTIGMLLTHNQNAMSITRFLGLRPTMIEVSGGKRQQITFPSTESNNKDTCVLAGAMLSNDMTVVKPVCSLSTVPFFQLTISVRISQTN
jgi:hypothetical protein